MGLSFLEDHGVVWQDLGVDERALLVCQKVRMEMLNLLPEAGGSLDLTYSLQLQMEHAVCALSFQIVVKVDNKGA